MQVTFTRTATRRYSVTVIRPTGVDLVMEPAPGFDEHLPHDLVHFLVERHWALSEGIYGDLAAGGDAGTFRPVEAAPDRRGRKRSGLVTSGGDMDRSERLAAAVFAAWQVHRGAVPAGSAYAAEAASSADVDAKELAGILSVCDDLAAEWSRLPVGGELTLEWLPPAQQLRRRGQSARRR